MKMVYRYRPSCGKGRQKLLSVPIANKQTYHNDISYMLLYYTIICYHVQIDSGAIVRRLLGTSAEWRVPTGY